MWPPSTTRLQSVNHVQRTSTVLVQVAQRIQVAHTSGYFAVGTAGKAPPSRVQKAQKLYTAAFHRARHRTPVACASSLEDERHALHAARPRSEVQGVGKQRGVPPQVPNEMTHKRDRPTPAGTLQCVALPVDPPRSVVILAAAHAALRQQARPPRSTCAGGEVQIVVTQEALTLHNIQELPRVHRPLPAPPGRLPRGPTATGVVGDWQSAWASEVVSATLYSALTAVTTWRLLAQCRRVRAVGDHLIFHSVFFALTALRTVCASYCVVALDAVSVANLSLLYVVGKRLAFSCHFGCNYVCATYVVRKLGLLPRGVRKGASWIFWCSFLSLACVMILLTFLEELDLLAVRRYLIDDVFMGVCSALSCTLFTWASFYVFRWWWLLRSRKGPPAAPTETTSLVLNAGTNSVGCGRRPERAAVLFAMLLTVWTTSFTQGMAAVFLAFDTTMPNQWSSKLIFYWLPEIAPAGVILLWLMRDVDADRKEAPLLFTIRHRCAVSPPSRLPRTVSEYSVAQHATPTIVTASTATTEVTQGAGGTPFTGAVRPSTVPVGATEYSVTLELAPHVAAGLADSRPVVVLTREGAEGESVVELDRTEVEFQQPVSTRGSKRVVSFNKSLLLKEEDLSHMPVTARVFAVHHGDRDTRPSECLGVARLGSSHFISGEKATFFEQSAPAEEGLSGQPTTQEVGSLTLHKENFHILPPRSLQPGCFVKTFVFGGSVPQNSSRPSAAQQHPPPPLPPTPVRIRLREELWESLNAFAVPRQMLAFLIPQREEQLQRLQAEHHIITTAAAEFASAGARNLDEAVTFDDVIHELEDVKRQAVLERQLETALLWFAEHVAAMKKAAEAYRPDTLQWSFKPSLCKGDGVLRFVATNLHVQEMSVWTTDLATDMDVLPPASHVIVTFGAPTAHVYHSGKYGARQLGLRLESLDDTGMASPSEDLTRLRHQRRQLLIERKTLSLVLAMRQDVVICQAASALAGSFCGELQRRLNLCDAESLCDFLSQIDSCGFLVQFESLLSTRGSEAVMLGDFDSATRWLESFRLKLVESGADVAISRPVRITSTGDGWIMEVLCPSAIIRAATSEQRRGRPISVKAVLFTQGINEQQTVANAMGDAMLQGLINTEQLARLKAYFASYTAWRRRWASETPSTPQPGVEGSGQVSTLSLQVASDLEDLAGQLGLVEEMVRQKRTWRARKNVGLLAVAADLCRRLGGGRCTSCKSAKDRTAMSVTWEEARLLSAFHGLPPGDMEAAMHALRSVGVRRCLLVKNTGDDRYAFNPLQQRLLPAVFRAPPGAGGTMLDHAQS